MFTYQQAEQIVEKYIKMLYAYALKRTANLQDAEDLAQDIILKLYSTLLVKDIYNLDAFVWRLAHNVLVNYYKGKAKCSIGISLDELEPMLQSDEEPSDRLIEKETAKRLQYEIAYLSKTQREILIMYYYEGKKQDEISACLGLPLGTVKWHLFSARAELKKGMETMRDVSELKFNPIKFSGAGISGSIGTTGGPLKFFRSVLTQNIAYSVYHEAKTINEIADCMGVSPIYVESEVEYLEEYGYLIKKSDKYLANLIIEETYENSHELVRLREELYSKAAELIANELFDELINSDLINSPLLYYPDRDKNFLVWGLIPYLLANSNEGFEEKISFEEVATIRKDGANNIAIAYIEDVNEPKHKYYDSMQKWKGPMWNAVHNGADHMLLWQVSPEWSNREIDLDGYSSQILERDLKILCRFVRNDVLSGDELAYMVQKGYLKADNGIPADGKFKLAVIWLKDEAIKQELIALSDKVRRKCQAELKTLKEQYVRLVLENYPKHIQKMKAYGLQYMFYADGAFLLYSLKELLNTGRLKLPKDEQRVSLSMLIIQ